MGTLEYENQERPTALSLNSPIASMSLGGSYSLLLTKEGELLSSGANGKGELGDGSAVHSRSHFGPVNFSQSTESSHCMNSKRVV